MTSSADPAVAVPQKPKKTRVPPIIVPLLDHNKLIEKAASEKFQIKIMKNNQKLIKCDDKATHSQIVNILKDQKIQSHTLQCSDDRNVIFLCKGIQYTIDADTIKNDIERQIGDVVISVRNFDTARSRKGNYNVDIHVVQFKPNTCVPDILAITGIYWHEVTWEKFSKRQSSQCVNCRNFGHSRNYCTYKYRCIRCKNEHAPGVCPFKEAAKAVCANCGGEHPANYRGCPEYVKHQQKLQHRSPTQRNRAHSTAQNNMVNNVVTTQPTLQAPQTSGQTFASVVNPTRRAPRPSTSMTAQTTASASPPKTVEFSG